MLSIFLNNAMPERYRLTKDTPSSDPMPAKSVEVNAKKCTHSSQRLIVWRSPGLARARLMAFTFFDPLHCNAPDHRQTTVRH